MIGSGLRPGAWSAFKTRFGVDHICELYAASDGNIGFTTVLKFDNTVGFSLMGWELVQYVHDRGAPCRNLQGRMPKVPTREPDLPPARIANKAHRRAQTHPHANK